jgi:anti-anti-sigma regulatory factor
MTMNTVSLKTDGEQLVQGLEQASDQLQAGEDGVILDFSAIRRISPTAIAALEKIAGIADQKAVKVVLCNVNVDVYKVLKLVRLAPRFCFQVAAQPHHGENGETAAQRSA